MVCSGTKESDDEDEEEENNTSPVKRPSNMTLVKVPQVSNLSSDLKPQNKTIHSDTQLTCEEVLTSHNMACTYDFFELA